MCRRIRILESCIINSVRSREHQVVTASCGDTTKVGFAIFSLIAPMNWEYHVCELKHSKRVFFILYFWTAEYRKLIFGVLYIKY